LEQILDFIQRTLTALHNQPNDMRDVVAVMTEAAASLDGRQWSDVAGVAADLDPRWRKIF
jgi:hypothetical protein